MDEPPQLSQDSAKLDFPNSQSRRHPLSEFARPPLPAFPLIPNACGALSIKALPPHSLFDSLSGVTQRPSHTLVDIWFSTRLYGKVWWTGVRDSCGANEDRTDEVHK